MVAKAMVALGNAREYRSVSTCTRRTSSTDRQNPESSALVIAAFHLAQGEEYEYVILLSSVADIVVTRSGGFLTSHALGTADFSRARLALYVIANKEGITTTKAQSLHQSPV